MDRLGAMAVFVAVVDAGGLSAAGRVLRMPVASVSRKVAELEAHLGVRLLERSTRKVVPTTAGEQYYRDSRRLLDDLQGAERTARGEFTAPRGELVVTAPTVFGRLHVVPVMAEFLAHYPEISASLLLSDRILNLLDEHADLAVRIGEQADSTMMAARLGEVRRVTCAAPSYLDHHARISHPSDLAGHDGIVYERAAAGLVEWRYAESGGTMPFRIRPRLVVTTADAAIAAAREGAGVTRVLSYQAVDGVRCGGLRLVLEDFGLPALPVHLIYLGGAPMAKKLRAFIDFAGPRLKARLADARL